MAQEWQAFASGVPSNGYNRVDRTFVEVPESIGRPGDPAATNATAEWSAMSFLMGMCAELGLSIGPTDAVVNNTPKFRSELINTLGQMDDAPALDTGTHSAISLMKGMLFRGGFA